MNRSSFAAAACALVVLLGFCATRTGAAASSTPGQATAQGSENGLVARVMEDVRPLLGEDRIAEAVNRINRGIRSADSEGQVFRLRMTNIRVLLSATLQGKVKEDMLREQTEALLGETSGRRRERAYLISGKVNAALGSYDRGAELLREYLDKFPEPPAEEAEQHKESSGRTHPRLLYRYLARRMLDKVEMVGEPVPEFDVTTLDGQSRTSDSYRGKVWLLNFWRTSSEPARRELSNLKSLKAAHGPDFAILGLSMGEPRDTLQSFVEERSIGWDQVHLGPASVLPNRFSVQSVPATFLMDEEGTVRAVGVRGQRLRKKVEELLQD